MIDLLKSLIEIESISKNEARIAGFLEEKLQEYFPDAVSVSDRNILVTLNGDSTGPTILLCSHIDTVPPVAGWTRDPFVASHEDDRIY